METNTTSRELQQAHAYLDHLPATQLAAVRDLLESMLDPVTRALANAPLEDEAITEDEERMVEEGRESLRHNGAITHAEAMRRLGLD